MLALLPGDRARVAVRLLRHGGQRAGDAGKVDATGVTGHKPDCVGACVNILSFTFITVFTFMMIVTTDLPSPRV